MNVIERFEKLLTKNPGGCWIWKGSAGEYGKFKHNRKTRIAHRVSYELYKSIIPDGLVVRHKCRYTHCVNPEHLELGTLADNQADRIRDGTDCRGIKNPQCKLTEEQVLTIRNSKEKINVLASSYHVSRTCISDIKNGRSWSWLE
jgi:hypothetical protein